MFPLTNYLYSSGLEGEREADVSPSTSRTAKLVRLELNVNQDTEELGAYILNPGTGVSHTDLLSGS